MSDTVKIKAVVSTGFVNCEHEDVWEVDKEWWYSLSATEQEQAMEEYAIDFRASVIDLSAWVVEEGEDD